MRYAITVRFNQAQKEDLMKLCEFWNFDEKRMIRFAIDQMVVSTAQMAKKIKQEQEATNAQDGNPAADNTVSGLSVGQPAESDAASAIPHDTRVTASSEPAVGDETQQ